METAGVNLCYWWFGQIVDDAHWKNPIIGKLHNKDQTQGETYSYKVRIIGRHDPVKNIPDSQLFNASVFLPVTAGSGLSGAIQTPNLQQGDFVAGFYSDGKEGNEPVIAYCSPNNPKTPLFGGDPALGFVPRSGFKGISGQKPLSTSDIDGSDKSTESIDPTIFKQAQKDQVIDGNRVFHIPKTRQCEGPSGQLTGIQRHISEAIRFLNLIKSGIIGTTSDLKGLARTQINNIQYQVSSLVKGLINSMRVYIVNNINKQLDKLLSFLEPGLQVKYNKEFKSVLDIILCIFQKINKNLFNLVKSTFNKIIDKYISAPLCAAEAFVSDILGNVFSEINDGISKLLSPLGISDITSQIFNGLSIVVSILSFLTCEESLSCEMSEQWSLFSGVSNSIESVGDNVSKKIESLVTQETTEVCSTSQLPCGPPSIKFISNTGTGAAGNPIISAAGSIIGIDILNPGSGYVTPPTIQFDDRCGNGSGATAIAITKDNKIDKVVMVDTGIGYLPCPDGSTGANGFTFSDHNDTIVFNETTGYSIHKCNTTIDVLAGDMIYLKASSVVDIYDNDGNILETIIGRGQTTPITINNSGILTTPECTERPHKCSDPNNTYPVILAIDDIALINPGFNYSSDDTIRVEPSNGAELNVVIENGSIKDVIIVNGGIGFTDLPNIIIDSQTGFNAKLVPVLKVIKDENVPAGTSVINVIDCVGKI